VTQPLGSATGLINELNALAFQFGPDSIGAAEIFGLLSGKPLAH
jgi:hypothetical protein